jgi:hypothetical protein
MRIGRNFLVVLLEAAILSAACSFTTRAGEEPAAPRRMAEAAMEAERDQRHREKMRIVWPKDIPDCPDGSEVYLIDGYIDYRCRRLTWDGKEVRIHTAECKRTWFYNAKGESFEATTSALDPEVFKDAWKAAMLLIAASVEPAKAEREDAHKLGDLRLSYSSSSHQRSKWVRMTDAASVRYLHSVRGRRSSNGIADFEEMRNRAIFGLFEKLIEKKQSQPEPLATWASFLAADIARAANGIGPIPAAEQRLLLEPAFRILGETGHEAAAETIRAIGEKLKAGGEDYWAMSLREEAGYALKKIQLIARWDPAVARRLIRSNPHALYAQNDLSDWVRRRYFIQAPEAYHAQVLADIRECPDDVGLLRESIRELSEVFTGMSTDVIRTLMAHDDPEVAVDAAFAVLKAAPGDKDAAVLLDRLVSDPRAPINDSSDWFSKFARSRALDFVMSPQAPAGSPWDAARIRNQPLFQR